MVAMPAQDNLFGVQPQQQVLPFCVLFSSVEGKCHQLTVHRPQHEATYHTEKCIHHSTAIHGVDLTANLEAKIKNPLAGIPKHELMAQVEDFADEKCLAEYTDLLKKGALIAQDPEKYEDIPGEHQLTQEECDALQAEVQHKWRIPRMLYVTIVTCSIAAAVQGWDQEGSNGANLSFPQALGLDTSSTYGTYIQGLINSGPYVGSSCVCLFHFS